MRPQNCFYRLTSKALIHFKKNLLFGVFLFPHGCQAWNYIFWQHSELSKATEAKSRQQGWMNPICSSKQNSGKSWSLSECLCLTCGFPFFPSFFRFLCCPLRKPSSGWHTTSQIHNLKWLKPLKCQMREFWNRGTNPLMNCFKNWISVGFYMKFPVWGSWEVYWVWDMYSDI